MKVGSEKLQNKYKNLNEADGPVFKIKNDPRFTLIGKYLARTGIDELPQLINIMKGEMSFVGPRPLPINEAKAVPKIYELRFSVLPGFTSTWWVRGNHKLSFKEWMRLDLEDTKNISILYKIKIIDQTIDVVGKIIFKKIFKNTTSVIIFCLFVFGLFLRVRYMLGYAMWADEAFYTTGTRDSSLVNVLLANHPFKDNPPLFFLFLRYWSRISDNLIWLRIPGIILYGFSFYILQKLFEKADRLAKIFVAINYSLLPYFVYINFWISPYNFVFFFELAIVYLILEFIKGTVSTKKFLSLFILFNFLAVNIHYSFIYFLVSYLPIAVVMYFKNRDKLQSFVVGIVVNIILAIPNIIVLWSDAPEITAIANKGIILELSHYTYVIKYIFGNSFVLTYFNTVAHILFWSLVLLGLYSAIKNKLIYLYTFAVSFIFSTVTIIYALYPFMSSLMVERNFFTFFFGFYILIALILYSRKSIWLFSAGLILICLMTLIQLRGHKNKPAMAGDVSGPYVSQQTIDNFATDIYSLGKGKTVVMYGLYDTDLYYKYTFLRYYLSAKYSYYVDLNMLDIETENDFKNKLTSIDPTETLIVNFNNEYLPENFKNIKVINITDYLDK